MSKYSKFLKWLKSAAVRAAKTAAQSAVAFIGTSYALGDVDWIMCMSVVVLAAVLSLLTSIAGLPEVDKENDLYG